ncbi:unnamed protein product, partial [Urochloa humidicola]
GALLAEKQQEQAASAAASLLVLASASPHALAKLLSSFQRLAAVQGPATGGQGAQQLPGVPSEGSRAAVRPVAAAQLRRPREPAAEEAV